MSDLHRGRPHDGGHSFAFILVLFILLAIIGCVCYGGYQFSQPGFGFGCGC